MTSYSKVLCMDGIDLMKHLADNKVNVDLIYTDPPYLIEKISTGGSVNENNHVRRARCRKRYTGQEDCIKIFDTTHFYR